MKKVESFYYQPDFLNNMISWSWTLMILIVGIIFWLEVTTFNWTTATFFALFIVVISVQTVSRTVEIIGSELIINRVIKSNFTILSISKIKNVTQGKMSLSFDYGNKRYKLLMSRKSSDKLFKALTKKG
ncbi:pore-forming protein [Pediococcus pentosaceus]|uniref:EbsA family protein n=1 Tax=Pediococcus pentosaceus TaxID=1255 RepID=UPI0018E0EB26|nr:EbsA family protein [Pediococcus pentosaceus]MBF7103849.1 pore-forming protein [Pediococcus pentosaceus]QQC62082.1 pore-forming protein [Pediococcus pentosaceus]